MKRDHFDFDPVTSYTERDDQNLLLLEQEIDRNLHTSQLYQALVSAARVATDENKRNKITDRILNLRDTVAQQVIRHNREA